MNDLIAYCGLDCEICCGGMGRCEALAMIIGNNADARRRLKEAGGERT